jgi:hypothetical protein
VRRVVPIVALGVAGFVLAPAHARDTASRVIDQTFVCQTGYLGGVHQLEARAHKSVRREGGSKRYGFVSMNTNLPEGFLGGVETGSIWVSRRYCRATDARPPLTRAGLRGGAIGPFERRIDCFTPRQVLIRIRGESARPASLKAVSPYGYPILRALGNFRKVEIAIGTPKRRLLAYASVDATQRTQLFTAPDCQED